MISKEKFMPLDFFKKEPFSGSWQGMRYRVEKWEKKQGDETETVLRATVWPEPLCYEAAVEEQMERKELPFTEDGVLAAVDWLNEQYERRLHFWREQARV